MLPTVIYPPRPPPVSTSYFLHQRFGALVVDVTFGGRQQRTSRVHGDAAARVRETRAGGPQLVQSVKVCCIQHAYNKTIYTIASGRSG